MPHYNKDIDNVVFSPEESEADRCPVCGGEPDYGVRVDLDDSLKYPWGCKCGAEGSEFARKIFDGHHVGVSTISEEQLAAYMAASDVTVLFRVEYETAPVRHLAVRCPNCEAWLRSEQASSDIIPDMVVAEFSRYKCTACGHEFCPAELGEVKTEECGSADQVYRDCAG